jgi:transposase
MESIAADDIVIGVDTHKDTHVAWACDGLGRHAGDIEIPATNDGYAALLAWAIGLGQVAAFGVEGTGSYGVGLARFLRRHGRKVIEVSRPPRAGQRRLSGKSDVIDAEHAARQILAGSATAIPKLADGQVEAIWSAPRLADTYREAACGRLGRSCDAASASAGVPWSCCRFGAPGDRAGVEGRCRSRDFPTAFCGTG